MPDVEVDFSIYIPSSFIIRIKFELPSLIQKNNEYDSNKKKNNYTFLQEYSEFTSKRLIS